MRAEVDLLLALEGPEALRVAFQAPSYVVKSSGASGIWSFGQSTGIVEILESGATRLDSVRLEGAVVSVSVEGEIGLVHHSQAPPVDLVADLRVEEPSLRRMASGLGLRLDAAGATSVRVQGPLDRPSVTPR